MRVFVSYSKEDAKLAAQLEDALRRRNIEVWSDFHLEAGEDWRKRVDEEAALSDALLVLIGAETAITPHLESEWRAFLRNDWESNKPLIPCLIDTAFEDRIPAFLRSRRSVALTHFDTAVDQIEHLLKHPGESIPRAVYERARVEHETYLKRLEEFALALKDDASRGSGEAERHE